jgi:hypothetical protein
VENTEASTQTPLRQLGLLHLSSPNYVPVIAPGPVMLFVTLCGLPA